MPEPQSTKDSIKQEINKIPPTTDKNLLAAVSYVWILGLVMLLVKKDDEFVLFHARQAVVLFVISLLGFIPVLGWFIALLTLVGMIIGFIKAWQGQRYEIPVIYNWSQKIKL